MVAGRNLKTKSTTSKSKRKKLLNLNPDNTETYKIEIQKMFVGALIRPPIYCIYTFHFQHKFLGNYGLSYAKKDLHVLYGTQFKRKINIYQTTIKYIYILN